MAQNSTAFLIQKSLTRQLKKLILKKRMYTETSSGEILMIVVSWFLCQKKTVRKEIYRGCVKKHAWLYTETCSGGILMIALSWFLWKKKSRTARSLLEGLLSSFEGLFCWNLLLVKFLLRNFFSKCSLRTKSV